MSENLAQLEVNTMMLTLKRQRERALDAEVNVAVASVKHQMQVDSLSQELLVMRETIDTLSAHLEQKKGLISSQELEILELKERVGSLTEQLQINSSTIVDQFSDSSNNDMAENQQVILSLKENVRVLTQQVAQKDEGIFELKKAIAAAEAEHSRERADIISAQEKNSIHQKTTIASLAKQVEDRESEIADLRQSLASSSVNVNDPRIAEQQSTIDDQLSTIDMQSKQIANMNQQIAGLNEDVSKLTSLIMAQNQSIMSLQSTQLQVNEVLESPTSQVAIVEDNIEPVTEQNNDQQTPEPLPLEQEQPANEHEGASVMEFHERTVLRRRR